MKGILFSISSFLLLIGIFLLAVSFSLYNIRLNDEVSRNLAFDRTFYEYESVETMAKDLFYSHTGTNITFEGLNVTIDKNLPNNLAAWKEDMSRLELFVNNHSRNEVGMNFSAVKNQLAINITPGIIFRHLDYGNEKVEFAVPSNILSPRKLNGYDVFVDIGGINVPPEKCVAEFEGSESASESVQVCIFIKGAPQSCDLGCMDIDTTEESTTHIDASRGTDLDFTVGLNGKLTFESNVPVYIRVKLMLNNITEPVRISYPQNILQVNFTDFSTWKNDTIYLYRFPT